MRKEKKEKKSFEKVFRFIQKRFIVTVFFNVLACKYAYYILRDLIEERPADLVRLLKCLASNKFDGFYMSEFYQILLGLDSGLHLGEIMLYARPEFNEKQMREIRSGFEQGLTLEQIQLYAKPEFDHYQMEEIKLGLKHGLTLEQVKFYAKPEFKWHQMREIRERFQRGWTFEQVMSYVKQEFLDKT